MNLLKTQLAVSLGLLALASDSPARADEVNKKTILTIKEPLAIPGAVLQPGKYVLKLVDSASNRNIVQVMNEDENKVETTILAIPTQRLKPAEGTQFGFWEMPAGSPRALRVWFYPGDTFGQEFAYPKDMAATIAQTNNEAVPAMTSSDVNSAKVETVNPPGANNSSEMAAVTPAPTPEPPAEQPAPPSTTVQSMAEQPAPAPQPSATDQPTTPQQSMTPQPSTMDHSMNQPEPASTGTLPRTASVFPLLGLGGLLSFAAAAGLRKARQRG